MIYLNCDLNISMKKYEYVVLQYSSIYEEFHFKKKDIHHDQCFGKKKLKKYERHY